MAEFTGSTQVATPPQVLSAQRGNGEEVHTTAVLPGRERVEGRAWFRVDREAMHLAWGSEQPDDYRGDLDVRLSSGGDRAEPDQAGEVEMRLHTTRVSAGDTEVQKGIERLVRRRRNPAADHVVQATGWARRISSSPGHGTPRSA